MQQKNFKFLAKAVTGFLLEENLRGRKRQQTIVFKTIGYCSYCSFIVFPEILGGKSLFFWGGRPTVAVSQVIL